MMADRSDQNIALMPSPLKEETSKNINPRREANACPSSELTKEEGEDDDELPLPQSRSL